MVVDLKRVFVNDGFSMPIDYLFDMSDVEISGNYPLKKPVKFTATVTNRAGLVELKATVLYLYEADCDRCGKNVAKEHTVIIDKALAANLEGEENDGILLTEDMKLDLDELIYSEVIVNLPMKHLCSDECKGLCPKCGKNLNDGDCLCPKKEIDPRLSALAELLNN